MKNVKSFTLIELLIAISIFAVIMVTLLSAFRSGIFGFRQIEESAIISEAGYTALNRIDRDLRNSFAYSPQDAKFTGEKDTLGFLTLNPKFTYVSYSFNENRLLRLSKADKDALKSESEIKPKILAQNIKQIDFVYIFSDIITKNLKESNAWNDPASLPVAVRISITFMKREEAPFVRTIYLP